MSEWATVPPSRGLASIRTTLAPARAAANAAAIPAAPPPQTATHSRASAIYSLRSGTRAIPKISGRAGRQALPLRATNAAIFCTVLRLSADSSCGCTLIPKDDSSCITRRKICNESSRRNRSSLLVNDSAGVSTRNVDRTNCRTRSAIAVCDIIHLKRESAADRVGSFPVALHVLHDNVQVVPSRGGPPCVLLRLVVVPRLFVAAEMAVWFRPPGEDRVRPTVHGARVGRHEPDDEPDALLRRQV